MAEIYRVPQGAKSRGRDRLNYVVAHHAKTDAMLKLVATPVYERAKAILGAHRDTGLSEIQFGKGDVDYYITLDDTKGGNNARGIEHRVSPLRGAIKGD